jgi:hypothetical protein
LIPPGLENIKLLFNKENEATRYATTGMKFKKH